MRLDERRKIDRVFHTLESKGYECVFYDTHVLVINKNKIGRAFPFLPVDEPTTALKNTAKLIAHVYGVRYNEPFEVRE